MIKIKVHDFNLKDTVTCGQIFRYKEEADGSYTIIISDRVINAQQNNDTLIAKSNNEDNLENVIKDYFDLNSDYTKINNELIKNNKDICDVIDKCNGLKMIKQDKFETIIAYIISQNNRVPMIAKCLDNISEKYGKKVLFNENTYYLFPTIDELSHTTKEELRSLKVGFRDEYIIGALNDIKNGKLDINKIDSMSSEDALNELMKIKGIGEKVASCILLFAYQKKDVFPIDTWVKKYMKEEYGIISRKDIKKYAKETYKEYSGIAIQYMFHAKRNK